MIVELGHFALIIALTLAAAQVAVPGLGSVLRQPLLMTQGGMLAVLQFVFVLLAFACLTAAFVADDFSVKYVAENSSAQTPLLYKISGVWGAHEGSLLLWVLMLAGWQAAAAVRGGKGGVPTSHMAKVLAVLGAISVGFMLFTLLTSNPFARLPLAPAQGRELNPLLQDIGLALHPPLLYMGYVGFSVAFAHTIAALISGKMDAAWARWTRQWACAAWLFLTLGIMLGSWWAYYELGWGGWWFWDPVENASFMPWLAGTALIHSLAAVEARGVYRAWTAFLALLTFSLSLLGAFIVRSGILTSVHAFASDPTRGVFILVFLGLTVGGALLLFAARAPLLQGAAMGGAAPLSREGGLLLNNLLLSAALLCVFVGTLYPLFLEVLGGGKISVGAPYFNAVFVPLTAPLAFFAGAFALARWKKDSAARLGAQVWGAGALAAGGGALLPLLFAPEFAYAPGAALGLGLAIWIVLTSARALLPYWRQRVRPAAAVVGMALAHIGLGVFIAGVSVVSHYDSEKDVRLAPGESYTLRGYTFVFSAPVQTRQRENYHAQTAEIAVYQNGALAARLYPEKRRYASQQQPLTEAAIDAGFLRDVYVSLGEPLQEDESQAWSVRLQIKPLVRWVWGGALLMAAGALVAMLGRRRVIRDLGKAGGG